MQPVRKLHQWLETNASHEHYLFTIHDLHAIFPDLSLPSLKTLLSRAVASKYLERICRGVYLYRKAMPHDGNVLFHVAALLRAEHFNYISLETALSELGVISQIPINVISVMSSGRSNTISCGHSGTIEFIHTSRTPDSTTEHLIYHPTKKMWYANVMLALDDMKRTKRSMDLIQWDIVDELI